MIATKVLASLLLYLGAQQPGFFGSNFSSGLPAPVYSSAASCQMGITGATTNCTLTAAGGEVAIIWVAWNSVVTTVSSLTDSAGGTITNIYGLFSVAHPSTFGSTNPPTVPQSRSFDMYVLPNLSAGSHTITVTWSGSQLGALSVSSFTGAATTTAAVTAISTFYTINLVTNPFTCNAVTTTTDNNAIFVAGGSTSGGTATNAGSGYTKIHNISGISGYMSEYKTGGGSTAGPYSALVASPSTTLAGWCQTVAIR